MNSPPNPELIKKNRKPENKKLKKRSKDKNRQRNSGKNKSNSSHSSRSRSRSRSDSCSKKFSYEKKRKSKWSDGPDDYHEKLKTLITIPSSKMPATGQVVMINPEIQINNAKSMNSLISAMTDSTKFQRKIIIPKQPGVNFVGLLIGPKGTYQKRLESQTNCKILIRGKNTQKEIGGLQQDEEDEQHVLVVGETEESVIRAQLLIERVLSADLETRNKIKEEQLKAARELRSDNLDNTPELIEDHLMTPYGPPDKNARILPVPNDSVGLIIGKNGETIRRLHRETGCRIQIAKKQIPNTEVRNVFIEGPNDKYEFAKKMIEDIVAEQQKMKAVISNISETNPFPGPYVRHKVLEKHIGLIIGKNGENIKNLHQKTSCYIFIPKECGLGEDFRILEISGDESNINECIRDIENLISNSSNNKNSVDNENYFPVDFNYLNKHTQYMQQQHGMNTISLNDNFVSKMNPSLPLNNVCSSNMMSNMNLVKPQNVFTTNMQFISSKITNLYFNMLQQRKVMNNNFSNNIIHNHLPKNLSQIANNNSFNNKLVLPNQMIHINNYFNNSNQINNYMPNNTTLINPNLNNSNNMMNNYLKMNNQISNNHNIHLMNNNKNISNPKVDIKKNDDNLNSKKNSGGILNYIYGGQV